MSTTWMTVVFLAGMVAGPQESDPKPGPKPEDKQVHRRVLRQLDEKQQRRFATAYGTGVDLCREKKWDRAVKAFEEALTVDPHHPQSAKLLGFCHVQLKDWEKATRALLTAMNLSPQDAELRHLVVQAFTEVGRNEEALVLLEDTKKRLGKSPDLLRQEVHLRNKLGHDDKVLPLLQEWKRADPKNSAVRHQLMEHYESAGDITKALKEALDYVVVFPTDLGGRVRVSHLLVKAKRFEEAGQVLENLVRDNPDQLPLRKRLVDLYEGPLKDPARAQHHRQMLEQVEKRSDSRVP